MRELLPHIPYRLIVLCLLANVSPVAGQQTQGSWADTRLHKTGKITVWWYESRPFIFQDEHGKMKGIEPEIILGFQKFLKANHNVDLKVEWHEANDFGDVYNTIKSSTRSGIFGASAFSITPERRNEVDFSPPYMADITVLISSKGVPLAESAEDFKRIFSNKKAVTIKATTYELDLLRLSETTGTNYEYHYIPSSQNILLTIEKMDDGFGYIDLPVYLMLFNKNTSIRVNRQNFAPIKREGYSFIYPRNGDWAEPLNEYFRSPGFKPDLEKTMAEYFNTDLYHFVESLPVQSDNPILLLTKEKEIQDRDILGKSLQLESETRIRNYLILTAVVISLFLIAIIVLYNKSNAQKREIELQRKNIEMKSQELEERNRHLIFLDEEKNNLVKILAHDLRTPINHVKGLAHILLISNDSLPEDQKAVIRNIGDAAVRLNKMITGILDIDALENNRVRLAMEPVLIGPLSEKIVASFTEVARKKDIRLTVQSGQADEMISGDVLFLTQVLENLISNAIKFSPAGKAVTITVKPVHEKIIIAVRDEGPGLTPEDQVRLFKKFQRLSNRPTGGEDSTGLGLSIVKKYVELMGGSVWCESVVGEGSVFSVGFLRRKENS